MVSGTFAHGVAPYIYLVLYPFCTLDPFSSHASVGTKCLVAKFNFEMTLPKAATEERSFYFCASIIMISPYILHQSGPAHNSIR